MDAFGRANAGKEVNADQFLANIEKRTGKPVKAWLTAWEKKPAIFGPTFTTAYWLDEPESAVIVYGTVGDVAANREAALRTAMRSPRWLRECCRADQSRRGSG